MGAGSSGLSFHTKGRSSHHHHNSQGPIPALLSIETQPAAEPTGSRRINTGSNTNLPQRDVERKPPFFLSECLFLTHTRHHECQYRQILPEMNGRHAQTLTRPQWQRFVHHVQTESLHTSLRSVSMHPDKDLPVNRTLSRSSHEVNFPSNQARVKTDRRCVDTPGEEGLHVPTHHQWGCN